MNCSEFSLSLSVGVNLHNHAGVEISPVGWVYLQVEMVG